MMLLYCIFESFFSVFALMKLTQMETTNPVSLLLFFLFLFAYYKFKDTSVRSKIESQDHIYAGILCMLFTLFTLSATYQTLTAGLSNGLFCVVVLLFSAIGFLLIYHHFLLWIYLKTTNISLADTLYPVPYLPYLTFFVCILGWLPYFLYEFPGVLLPDSINQLQQAVGIWELTNHHSVLYTLLLALFYGIGFSVSNNAIIAVSVFTVFQMIFMAFVASYVVRTLQLAKLRTYLCVIALCFYAFMPYQGALASTVLKDIMFTGSFTLYIASLLRIMLISLRDRKKKSDIFTIFIPHIIAGIFLGLLRSNGLIVLFVSIPCILFVLRERIKTVLPLELIVLVLVLFIRFPCMQIYDIKQADTTEALSIPLQQIARVLADGENLTDTQYESLSHFMDPDLIAEAYQSDVSDPIKYLVRNTSGEYISTHKQEFFSLWFSIGIQHPKAYFDGYVSQTYGYWYPDAYSDVGLADGVFENEMGLSWQPILHGNAFIKIKEIIFKLQTIIPLYGLLFSVGFAFWAILIAVSICFRRQNNQIALLAVPSIILVLTLCMATPVAVEFRYAYPLIHGLPIYLMMPFVRTE